MIDRLHLLVSKPQLCGHDVTDLLLIQPRNVLARDHLDDLSRRDDLALALAEFLDAVLDGGHLLFVQVLFGMDLFDECLIQVKLAADAAD